MRISDWSSDVCSSDLVALARRQGFEIVAACQQLGRDIDLARTDFEQELQQVGDQRAFLAEPGFAIVARRHLARGQRFGIRQRRHQPPADVIAKSEEPTSELQSLMRISYAVFCLKKKIKNKHCN